MLKPTLISALLCLSITMVLGNDITLTVSNLDRNGSPCNSTSSDCGNGNAHLRWSRCGNAGMVDYTVFRNVDGTNWEQIATVSSDEEWPTYIDELRTCGGKDVMYQIQNSDGSCTSSIQSLNIVDKEQPATVQIDAVSVNPQTNLIEIFWTPCTSPDTYGYRIVEGIATATFDTIYGADVCVFTVNRPADTALRFKISAFDSCFNYSGRPSDEKQAFMCNLEHRVCEKKLVISWTDPQKSISDIAHLDIMLSRNGTEYALERSVEPSQNTVFIDVPNEWATYKAYVKAVSFDAIIFANSISDVLVVEVAPQPDFAYLQTLNVIDYQTLEMIVYVDVTNVWQTLFAYISDTLVATINYDQFRENDSLLLPYQNAIYAFKISDTCGEIVVSSENTGKPVRLEARIDESRVDLEFSAYQGWYEDEISYQIFEIKDGDTLLKEDFLPTPSLTHNYSIMLANPEHILDLSYYVVAYEEGSNPYGIKASAKSNTVTLISKNEIPIHFPTGFLPDGVSSSFYPFFAPRAGDVLQFQIYNKFNQMVFSTDRPRDGWDGTFKGMAQPPGVYIYQFSLTRNGQTTRKQGWFRLIR